MQAGSTSDPPTHTFTPLADKMLRFFGLLVVGGIVYIVFTTYFLISPETNDVGYQPVQPVLYSHKLHAGELGMDCRYCHSTVDQAGFAAVPSTQTCYGCHSYDAETDALGKVIVNRDGSIPGSVTGAGIKFQSEDGSQTQSPKLWEVVLSHETGLPIDWNKVHDLPDYVYFNHAAHVNRGIGCQECHGRVDQMGEEGVYQAAPLSMSWCLECHRNPEKYLRPNDRITDMTYRENIPHDSQLQKEIGARLYEEYKIRGYRYLTDCNTCHR